MVSSTLNPNRPKWLTEDVIKELRHDIETCPDPYTDEEIATLEFDGKIDMKRDNAYMAIKTLNKYGIPLTESEEK